MLPPSRMECAKRPNRHQAVVLRSARRRSYALYFQAALGRNGRTPLHHWRWENYDYRAIIACPRWPRMLCDRFVFILTVGDAYPLVNRVWRNSIGMLKMSKPIDNPEKHRLRFSPSTQCITARYLNRAIGQIAQRLSAGHQGAFRFLLRVDFGIDPGYGHRRDSRHRRCHQRQRNLAAQGRPSPRFSSKLDRGAFLEQMKKKQ